MMEACHFKMPAEMARKIIEIARDRDVTVGQILRDLIAQEIERVGQGMSPLTPEQRRFEALRVDLAPELRETGGWPAMQARLRAKGYELRLAGRVLALHSYPKGHRICLASDLGLAHDDLAARLGEAFPGHPDRQDPLRSQPPTQATMQINTQASEQASEQGIPQSPAREATDWPEHGATPAPAVAPPPPSYAPDPDAAPWPDQPDRTDPPAHRPYVNAAPNGLHLAEPATPRPRRAEPATSYSPPPPAAAVQQAQAHARALAEAHAQALSRAHTQAQASGQSQAQAQPRAKPQPTPRQDPRVPPAWLTSQRETA